MLPPGFDLTVERLRGIAAPEDTHGNVVSDWTSPSRLTIIGCWIGPGPLGAEYDVSRQTVVAEQWWYGPETADVLPTDRIRDVDLDLTYQVASDVTLNRDPAGQITHKTCKLKMIIE